jgi:hypothetical protein
VESKRIDIIEAESRMVVTRDWGDQGRGRDTKLINGYEIIVR